MIRPQFFRRDPLTCARALIGCHLRWGPCRGIVVETEAYDAEGDPACHTFFRPGARAFVAEHQAGDAYVYLNYGVHWMLNVLVKGSRLGFVLIRALEPLEGLDAMSRARGTRVRTALCSGPGKLTRAIGVTGKHHGMDLCGDPAFAFHRAGPLDVEVSARIGITRAMDFPWRFSAAGNPHVSRMPPKNPKAGRA